MTLRRLPEFLVIWVPLLISAAHIVSFALWTALVSFTPSTLIPVSGWMGFHNYTAVLATRNWKIAFDNLLIFGTGFVVLSMTAGIILAILVRLYTRVILLSLWPIAVTVLVVLLQIAITTFDLVRALTGGGPGLATQLPSLVVYDFMFQRGLLARGAAAAVLMVLVLLAVLLPLRPVDLHPAKTSRKCVAPAPWSTSPPSASRDSGWSHGWW